jgi:hypothetical protein
MCSLIKGLKKQQYNQKRTNLKQAEANLVTNG